MESSTIMVTTPAEGWLSVPAAAWYFPLINTTESLKILDHYSQSCIRYLATGKHTKAAYQFRYADMKRIGYISLVNRYYNRQACQSAEREDL